MKFNIRNIQFMVSDYIKNPEKYWANDSVFDKRNIAKIIKNRDSVFSSNEEIDSYAKDVSYYLQKRKTDARRTAIYLQSCGGSGCHFVGSLIGSAANAEMINEVYIPNSFKSDPCLIDFVNIFHSKSKVAFNDDLVLVNTGHLRYDFDPNVTKSVHLENLSVCLLRNPLDIVRSLAFRKQDYRDLTSKGVSDLEYFKSRCNHVLKFYKSIGKNFDDYLMYENLTSLPKANIKAFFYRNKIGFDEQSLDKAVFNNSPGSSGAKGAINYNSQKKHPLEKEFMDIYLKIIPEVSRRWGYE